MNGPAGAEPHFDRATVERVASLLTGSEPSAGRTRVLAIDGRSGAGKSSLAELVAVETGAPVVSLEYLYGGWDDLAGGARRLREAVLDPISLGEPASVPRYDWLESAWAEPIELEPPALLIVEGVGAFAPAPAELTGTGIWLEAPADVRRSRAESRDGGAFTDHWDAWALQETRLLANDPAPDRADLVIRSG